MSFGSTGLEHRRKSAGDADPKVDLKDLFPFRRKKIAAEQHRAETDADRHSLRSSPRRTCSADSATPSRTLPQRAFSDSQHSRRSSHGRAAPERTSSGALHSLLHTPRKPRRTTSELSSGDAAAAADTMSLMALQQALRSPRVAEETATPTSRELMRALRTPRRTCSSESRPKTPRSAGRSPRLATSFSPSSRGHSLDADLPRDNSHSRNTKDSASPSTRFRPRAVSPSCVRKITVQAIHSRHRRASVDNNDHHQGVVSPRQQKSSSPRQPSPRTPAAEQPGPSTETATDRETARGAATQLKSIPHLTSPLKATAPSKRRTACCDSPLAPLPDQPKRTSTCTDTTQEDSSSSSSSSSDSSTLPPLDAQTAELCYSWYSRMGQPTREKMRKKVSTLNCGFTVDDVDRLPWKVVGGRTVLNVHTMNKLFL